MDILISGLGIAGPTLAFWLVRHGHRPVIVESAPSPRKGGYIVDFWGAGYDVADRMGLIPRLNQRGYFFKEVRFVDGHGRTSGGFLADAITRATAGRYVSLPRSELSAAIYESVEGSVEVIWGDEIATLEQSGNGVLVWFGCTPPRPFDLVIGADGLHSNVRQIGFGDQREFERYLGYKVAAFESEGYRPRDENVYVSYSEPGRQIARFALRGDRTLFLIVFRDVERGSAAEDGRALVHEQFGESGWESRDILAAMDRSAQVYFDRVSQIRMDSWSNGRLALVGDAAACPSLLAGEGSALAMVAAYVLAGELAATSDYRSAFARYESRLRPFLSAKQDAAKGFAASFAPRTHMGILLRNLATRLFVIPGVADLFLGRSLKDDVRIPAYENETRPASNEASLLARAEPAAKAVKPSSR